MSFQWHWAYNQFYKLFDTVCRQSLNHWIMLKNTNTNWSLRYIIIYAFVNILGALDRVFKRSKLDNSKYIKETRLNYYYVTARLDRLL